METTMSRGARDRVRELVVGGAAQRRPRLGGWRRRRVDDRLRDRRLRRRDDGRIRRLLVRHGLLTTNTVVVSWSGPLQPSQPPLYRKLFR